MSIIEVAVSVSIMGTIALAIGSVFTSISATHQASDDLVDARRLIALQFALYDRAFNTADVRSPPTVGDPMNWDFAVWAPAMPTTVRRNGVPFPNLWARPQTYRLQLGPPPGGVNTPPASVNEFIRGAPSGGNQTLSALVPAEPVLGNQWHAWNTLLPEEQARLNGREIMMDVYLAKLDIRDTSLTTGTNAYSTNPYRHTIGGEDLWWIAQVDVVRRTNATTTILETAFRIGP